MFNNQIFGPVTSAPAIIYNDTNMSSDNISCTNLSGSIATFDQLSVVTFNPSSFSADYADITNLSCDNLSCRLRSTMGSISTGNLSADEITLTGDLNASDVYAENILSTGDQLLLQDATVANRRTMIRRDNASTWVSLGNVFSSGGNISFDYGDMLFTTGPGTSSTPEFQIRKSTNGTFAYNSSVLNLSARVALLTQTEVENILNMNDGSTLTLENTASLIGQGNSTISSTGEVSFNNLSLSGALTCVSNISTPNLYVNDTFFYGSTGTIVSSLVTMTNDVLYQLGNQNYKIRSVTGATEYMTCDSTLGNTNISNLSVDNLSTDLLNNISAGDRISLSTEAGTNKLVITGTGGLNSSNLSLDNLSITNQLTCGGNISTELIYLSEISIMDVNMSVQNSQFISLVGQDTYNLGSQNYNIQGFGGIKYLICDYTLGNTNISNLSVDNLSTNLLNNVSAGEGISLSTEAVTNKLVITATGGSVTDPLNLSKLNVSNISCDEGITTDTLTCDLTPNLVAGAGVSITSVGNKPTISAVNSVTANVPVSDFIETLQIVPSGTTAFSSQGVGQGSQLISVYDFQGGTAYTASNLFTVNAGDKIHFNWKQSGWVQTAPGQQSYVICYIVKGTNAIPQAGDRIEVGRIYQYIYSQSDHEEITGSFVYNVTSTFSFYRSQMEGASNLVTQQSDYGAATATVYRATVPNSIVVPTLIDATNISVVNLSVTGDITTPAATITDLTIGSGGVFNHDLTNNLLAGSNITITSVGGKAQISSSGGGVTDPLNISRLNASDVHAEALNVSGSAAFLSDGLTVFGSTTTQNISTNHISSAGFITAVGEISAGGGLKATGGSGIISTGSIQFNNAANGLGDNLEIYYTGTVFGMGTTSGKDFTINAGINTGGLVVDGTLNNINMSNCSITNLSLDTLTTDLTSNLTAGTNITITSVGGKPTISASGGGGGGVTDPLNISKLNASNISVDNDVTIARDLNVQRYFDSGRPRFMMLARTTALAQTGAGERLMVFDTNSTGQVAGEFAVANGGEIQVSTGGWYRLSWSIGFIRASGGDRYSFRSYNMTRTNAGSYTFVQLKDRIGSIGYCRSSSLNRECSSVGTVLRYIPANGWVKLVIGAMIQSSSNFASSFNGTNLRASANFMVEFVSSASET